MPLPANRCGKRGAMLEGILNHQGRKVAAINFLRSTEKQLIGSDAEFLLSLAEYVRITEGKPPIFRDIGILDPTRCNLFSQHDIGEYIRSTYIDDDSAQTINLSSHTRNKIMSKPSGYRLSPNDFFVAYQEVMMSMCTHNAHYLIGFFRNPTGKGKPKSPLGRANAGMISKVA